MSTRDGVKKLSAARQFQIVRKSAKRYTPSIQIQSARAVMPKSDRHDQDPSPAAAAGEPTVAATRGRYAGGSRSVSIIDVARRANVSAGTVSRAISRPEMISKATRERVLQAVRDLGYVANGAARALVMRQSRTIGAIVPRTGMASYSTLVNALEAELASAGYTLLLSAPQFNDAREPAILNTLLERRVDAVALLGASQPKYVIDTLAAHQKPFVLMWEHKSRHGHSVGFDEYAAGELLVEHLYQLGHRQIGMISGYTQKRPRSARRKSGVRKALQTRGMTMAASADIETEHGFREGFDAMQSMLAEPARLHGVTAIVCAADYLAAGALSALSQAGVSVPGQLSVVGFNDNDFAAFLHPPLTTVRLPIREIGEQAGRYLAQCLKGENPPKPATLKVELIERASSGKARRKQAL